MERQTDYAKLHPLEPTPDEELCRCLDMPPIKLMPALTRNPLHCMNCNLEVPAETLLLSQQVIEEMSAWNEIYHAIYILWLDSGAYEAWAREQLSATESTVNARGREVQRDLNTIRRCYYWYFQDQSADNYCPLRSCPVCGDALRDYPTEIFLQRVCDRDSIVMVGE
jgi:predicted  nucleic acid-binding Zn ribbon protein